MYNLSFKIITYLEKRGLLQDEDREIIAYGLFSFIFNTYCLVLCIIIGLLLNIAVESVVFFCSFLFIRRYAGGFHAKKEWMCLILSTLGIFLSLFFIYCIEHFIWLKTICFILSLISGIAICLVSPLEAENKPLSHDEKKKYRLFSAIRVSMAITTIILFAFFKINCFFAPVTTAILYEGALITGGYMNISIHNKK